MTHRENSQNFPKIDAVSTFPSVLWEYERDIQPISQCCPGIKVCPSKKWFQFFKIQLLNIATNFLCRIF